MSYRIFVEDKEVDTGGEFSAQFTYTIDDIRDFSARNTKFSKTIILPGTARNNRTFGHVFDVGNANFHNTAAANIEYNYNAAKAAKCLITQDGIPIFKGVIRILEIIIDNGRVEYETAVFGELGGLVSAIGDSKLEDLDLSAYNHAFTLANITASWAASSGVGYYYPLIDYGYTADGKSFGVETFRPAVYVKQYIDKIFSEVDYTYESTFFETDFFKNLIIPYNGLYPYFELSELMNIGRAASITATTTYQPVYWTLVNTSYLNPEQTGNPASFRWKRAEPVSGKFTLSFTLAVGASTAAGIRLMKNTNEVIAEMSAATSGVHTWEGTITIEPNDLIYFEYAKMGLNAATISGITFTITGQPTMKIPIGLNDAMLIGEIVPKNVLQKDFLVWLVKMFNLYIDEDKDTIRHLKIEPFYDYYSTETVDWEQKIDYSQPIRLKPMGELNARTYEFKYKDDSDYYNELYKKKYGVNYGYYLFDSGYEFAKDKETVEIGFSPTPLVGYSGSEVVMSAIQKRSGNSIERTASNIRILSRGDNITLTNHSLTVTSLGVTIGTYTYYPYAGHLDDPDAPTTDLNFGVPAEFYFIINTGYLSGNLFNIFWSYYMSEIVDKDSKVLTAFFKLSPVDIYNLDFSKVIHVKGYRWRLNSVLDYSTSQPDVTKCELLKVIDLE
jgi:hypothetical protein